MQIDLNSIVNARDALGAMTLTTGLFNWLSMNATAIGVLCTIITCSAFIIFGIVGKVIEWKKAKAEIAAIQENHGDYCGRV